MKKLAGFILISTLLWSCGSQFSRSKYDRYMWNRSNGKIEANTSDVVEEKESELIKTTDEVKVVEDIIETTTKSSSSDVVNPDFNGAGNNESSNDSEENFSSESNNHSLASETQNINKNEAKPGLKHKLLKHKLQTKPNGHSQKGGGGDANLILLVILAIILPPLGVYLKDGGITGLFWVTLILCLLGGGILFGPYGYLGGFWGLAAILALLRVFDVI